MAVYSDHFSDPPRLFAEDPEPALHSDRARPGSPAPPPPAAPPRPESPTPNPPAPIWLQRLSLFILVVFCIYLGIIVTVLPWWTSVWDQNPVFNAFPRLAHILHLGPVRGIISGLGLLDIWIGISEAIHYRDHRN